MIVCTHPEKTSTLQGSSAAAFNPALTWAMKVGVSPFWKGSINLLLLLAVAIFEYTR